MQIQDCDTHGQNTAMNEDDLKSRYSKLYEIYAQNGYDLLHRDYGVTKSREEFLEKCVKYVEKCKARGRKKENRQIFTNMYREYIKSGYAGVVKKFAYSGTKDALRSRFKCIVKEYDPKARFKELEKDNIRYYTEIYEWWKNKGFDGLVEKFHCSSNRRFLCRQLLRYVTDFETIEGSQSKFFNEPYEDEGKEDVRESKFWKGFDFSNATAEGLKEYILEHSDWKNVGNTDKRMHYTVYLIVNKVNGKLYLGQHQTDRLDDEYMGSGKLLGMAQSKYGMENFEKVILFDFDTFEEMNDMEIDMVSADFIKLKELVYNRCNGGLNGPSAEFQREMHRTGQWKAVNAGKVLCRNEEDGVFRYFPEGEIPEGWVKGGYKDEELRKEIGRLMEELHSLGSNYIWREGDTVEKIQNMIAQFRKMKADEEQRSVLWHEIFEYYKDNGRNKTLEKYETVDGIVIMDGNFEKYVKEDFEKFKKEREEKEQSTKDDIERLKTELISYGVRRKWDSYSSNGIRRMYSKFMRRKKLIDEKIAFYSPIMDECFDYTIRYAVLKYNDVNLHHKLAKYLPIRYKEYMRLKHGEEVDINENPYSCLAIKMGTRKRREASESELARRKANHDERVKLYNELVALGSTVEYREDMALTTLRRSIQQAKIRKSKKEAIIKEYNEFYHDIMSMGYAAACEKRNYTGTLGNLKKRFLTYVTEFKYDDFDTKYCVVKS